MRNSYSERQELREGALGDLHGSIDGAYREAKTLYEDVLSELQAAPEHLYGTRRLEGIENAAEGLKVIVDALSEASVTIVEFNW